MKRRDFVIAAGSAGLVGAVLPDLVMGATPCPPATLGIDGEAPVSTSCTVGAVTSFRLTSGVGGTLLPFTVGQPFKQGDIPAGQSISSDLATFQADVRNRWPDGSVKFAVLSGQKSMTANQPTVVNVLRGGASSNGSNLTEAALIALAPTASVALSGFGTVALSGLLGAPVRSILGSQMSEFHYRSAVGSDAHLVVMFVVRLYANNQIEIETVVENGYLKVQGPTQKDYSVTLTVNGTVRYTGTLSHKHHTRWAMPFWYGSDPQVTPKHDGVYLRATKMLPNYGNPPISAGALNALTQTIVPFQLANYHTPMGGTGFAPSIGLLTNWDAMYVVGQDARAYKAVIANAYAAGRYALHYRDETTRRPPAVMSYVGWGLGDNAGFGSQGAVENGTFPTNGGSNNDTWDMAHHPCVSYLAYLITGRWYFMEEMQFVTATNLFGQAYSLSYGGRNSSPLGTLYMTTAGSATGRGTAWALRTLACALAITPDSDTAIRNDLAINFQDNVDFYYTNYAAPGQGNALGMFRDYANYTAGAGYVSQSPWQDDFETMALGFAKDLGLPLTNTAATQLNALTQYKYKARVGIYGGSGGAAWCYLDGAPYTVRITDAESFASIAEFNSGVYANWGIAYQKTIGPNASCSVGGALRGGSGGDPTSAGTGYWGNSQPAISYAVDHNAPGAAAAYARLTGSSNWTTQVLPSFADSPVWYVVPR